MKYAAILALLCGAVLISQPSAREQVGPLPDGGFLLNSGWKLHPAGKQIPLDTLPMSTALTKDGKYLLVLNGGYRPPSVTVLDASTMQQVSTAPVADGWLGLTLSPDNSRVYVGGGSRAAVFEFAFSNGKLTAGREFTIVPTDKRTWEDFTGDVALSPDGRLIYAAMLYRDMIAVINPQSGMVIERFKTGRRPYRILFHPDGQSLFVTGWGDGSLTQHKAESGERLGMTRLGPHPTDIVWSARKPDGDAAKEAKWAGRLFIPAANTNKVYVLAVSEAKTVSQLETINVSMTPMQPLGMTPTAVALNKAETTLYVACSDANAVAVADVSGANAKVLGFIPTGWYPTAVRPLANETLVVLNGRGLGSKANPNGPAPVKRPELAHLGTQAMEYVGRIQTGTASVIDPVTPEQLDKYTQTVIANSPYNDSKLRGGNRHSGRQSRASGSGDAHSHQARHLYRQGEPHLRSGFRRHR